MSFNLTDHIAQHPIADKAYLRHLRTADVFNEVQDARLGLEVREQDFRRAKARLEAAIAKATIMQALEDLQ